MPLFDRDLIIESKSSQPLVGFRGWDIRRPGLLASPKDVWLPGMRMEAVCERVTEAGHCPDVNCSCGIYTFKTASEVHEQGYGSQHIFGELWLWGKVVEHKTGFRAQYAYPKTLFVRRSDYDRGAGFALYDRIRDSYGVPMEVLDEHDMWSPSLEKRQELERLRKEADARARMTKLEKAQATRKGREVLEARAKTLPPTITDKGFKNLLEQIEWETKALVAKELRGREK